MAPKVTVTKIHSAGSSVGNRRPSSGDVMFSDGRDYGFLILPEMVGGGIAFFGFRRRQGGQFERFSFRSPAREAALSARLGL